METEVRNHQIMEDWGGGVLMYFAETNGGMNGTERILFQCEIKFVAQAAYVMTFNARFMNVIIFTLLPWLQECLSLKEVASELRIDSLLVFCVMLLPPVLSMCTRT